jgi:hypothetical protein
MRVLREIVQTLRCAKEAAMKPKKIVDIAAILLLVVLLWGLVRYVAPLVQPWPSTEGVGRSHVEHVSLLAP